MTSSLPRLLQLSSQNLPVGAYAYSQAQEWAIAQGTIKDDETKIKSYVVVPTEYLRTIITKEDADREPEESYEPGIHHERSIQQAAIKDA